MRWAAGAPHRRPRTRPRTPTRSARRTRDSGSGSPPGTAGTPLAARPRTRRSSAGRNRTRGKRRPVPERLAAFLAQPVGCLAHGSTLAMSLAPLREVYCRPVPILIAFFLIAWLCNALSLAAADWIFDGVQIDGFWPLVIGGAVLGIANSIVKPILTLLTLPLVILTLGLVALRHQRGHARPRRVDRPPTSRSTASGPTSVPRSSSGWSTHILHGLFGLRRDREQSSSCRPSRPHSGGGRSAFSG